MCRDRKGTPQSKGPGSLIQRPVLWKWEKVWKLHKKITGADKKAEGWEI